MNNTTYKNIPYPTVEDRNWPDIVEDMAVQIDASLHEQEFNTDETLGVRGVTETALEPYTFIGLGRQWPSAEPRFGAFTVNGFITEWFEAITKFMSGTLSVPTVLPELVYMGSAPAASGTQVAGRFGPVVRLRNDGQEVSSINSPVYMSASGGVVPMQPLSGSLLTIIPRVGNPTALEYFARSNYLTQKLNQDLYAPTDGVQDFTTGRTTKTYASGSYRAAYFQHDNFVAETALTVTGLAYGTFRIYGLDVSGTVIYEDLDFDGSSGTETHTTTRTDWNKVIGVSYKGVDLADGTSVAYANSCVVDVQIKSASQVSIITTLKAMRYAASAENVAGAEGDYDTYGDYPDLDYDKFTLPDKYFRLSWESYDKGWLWDSSDYVNGLPTVMLGIGLRDNRIAFLNDNITGLEIDNAQAVLDVKTLMTTELCDVPTTPQPMYVLGYNSSGTATVWTVEPTLVFTTADYKGYDGYWYGGNNTSKTEDFPEKGWVATPEHDESDTGQYGTVYVYQYNFPTDIVQLTQIFWANADELLQYNKMVGGTLAIPVGRALGAVASGQPIPVSLWTHQLAENSAKFSAVLTMLINYQLGGASSQRLVDQLVQFAAMLRFSETETKQLLQALPLLSMFIALIPQTQDSASDTYNSGLAPAAMTLSIFYLLWLLSPSAVTVTLLGFLMNFNQQASDTLDSFLETIELRGEGAIWDGIVNWLKQLFV